MKQLYATSDRTRAHLLAGALAAEGVPAVVQGEHLTPLQGELPTGASAEYRVCILDEEQWPRASHLAAQWLSERATAEPWVCARCGERHEAHFRSCWNCGAEADAAT